MLLDPKMLRLYGIVTSAALTKVCLLLLGYWLGGLIDEKLGTSPLFLLLCVSAALGLGIWGLIQIIKRSGF